MFLAICAFNTLSICVLTFIKSPTNFMALLYGEIKLPTCNKSAHRTLLLTLFQLLKPSIVNVEWRDTLFSKRKHGKENTAFFDEKYFNHGNWSNQVYWNQRYCLLDLVLGYYVNLVWYRPILI